MQIKVNVPGRKRQMGFVFFQILEIRKVSTIVFQFLEKCFFFPIFQTLENKLEIFQLFKNWKEQMNKYRGW